MIEKLTPEQIKDFFDLSNTSDVTDADRRVATKTFSHATRSQIISFIRLLKHYHPELFVDQRLEAAKNIARQILAEEYKLSGNAGAARFAREGKYDNDPPFKATLRALMMDPPTGEAGDA